jgi:hypothetical protein
MKNTLLASVLMIPGLAMAAEAVPDAVKRFSEQQGIKIIKKSMLPAERQPGLVSIRTWALPFFCCLTESMWFQAIFMMKKVKTSARTILKKRSTCLLAERCGSN